MPEQVKYIINDSDAKIVVCSNRDLWLKVEAVKHDFPSVRHFVLIDEQGAEGTLSHGNFVSNSKALDAVTEFTDKDTILSFLPLSHVLERMTTLISTSTRN